MSFLKVENKYFLISGVSNKKSIAFFVAQELVQNGAKVIFSVQTPEHASRVEKLFPESKIYLCDVENEASVKTLGTHIGNYLGEQKLQGFLHSMAFANYADGIKPFHETKWPDFAQASQISCFSLTSMSAALKNLFADDASVVTVSISNTRATNYGYMGPIKAMLDASVAYLAKSFSGHSRVRFNAVCSGPLKTSASAGIPGYVDNYLFAEKLTLRKEALATSEVADTICYLLSPRSSGINATGILVDAGMSCNYFDESVVAAVSKS
jgi:enoyl-[acyl-carrier protein] reductase I